MKLLMLDSVDVPNVIEKLNKISRNSSDKKTENEKSFYLFVRC